MDGQTDVQGARKGRKEEEGNKERKNTARRNALEPAGFGEWYALYPRKVARHQAAAAFRKMVPAEISAEALIERTKLFAEKWVHPNVDLQYCPYPATWLSQRRFLDAQAELAAPEGQAPTDLFVQQKRPEEFTRHQWLDALALLAEGKPWAKQHWGPAPGERGCLVPSDLLISAGFEHCD